jgi:hypothetical protein
MHVALGHARLAMASEFLNRPRRCALHGQMRAERVAEDMNSSTDVCLTCRFLDSVLNLLPCLWTAILPTKHA